MAIGNAGFDKFFGDLVLDLQTKYASDNAAKNILEFIETEISKEAFGIELTRRQKLVLKCFYGLELDEIDTQILDAWRQQDRTNYDFDIGSVARQYLILESGRRSGKSLVSSLIIVYEFYKLCLMDSPQRHYNIAGNSPISIYCLATVASQTKKTIYAQVKGLLPLVPTIKRLIDLNKVTVGEEEVKYPEKQLFIYSGNSKSSSQVGSAVILLVMDEVARFTDKDDRSNALELWTNLGNSGVTFGQDFKAVAVSSAWVDGDAIQTLYGKSKEVEMLDTWVGFRLRSWDMNPVHASRDNPVVKSAYALDPVLAALEFEGIRTSGKNTFFNSEEVKRCFRGTSVITASNMPINDDRLVRIQITSIAQSTCTTVMHLDPAIKRDAYALAFGHAEADANGDKKVIIDGILAWQPDADTQVSITNVQSCIYQIHANRPLNKVTSDHAQQAETIQRLKAAGINAESIFFSNRLQVEIYDATRKLMHEDRLILPKNSPWTWLLKEELLYVQHEKKTKINHMPDKTKDIADCVCAVVWKLLGQQLTNTRVEVGTLSAKQEKIKYDVLEEDFQNSRGDFMHHLRTSKSRWKQNSPFQIFNE